MALELPSHHRGTGLVDVLDRVLDKGLVIALTKAQLEAAANAKGG